MCAAGPFVTHPAAFFDISSPPGAGDHQSVRRASSLILAVYCIANTCVSHLPMLTGNVATPFATAMLVTAPLN